MRILESMRKQTYEEWKNQLKKFKKVLTNKKCMLYYKCKEKGEHTMFYLYDTTGFTLGSFGSLEDAIDEMEVLGGQEDLFISTDPNPWAR